jgi:hypothetical protein
LSHPTRADVFCGFWSVIAIFLGAWLAKLRTACPLEAIWKGRGAIPCDAASYLADVFFADHAFGACLVILAGRFLWGAVGEQERHTQQDIEEW